MPRGPAASRYKHGRRSRLWGDKLPDGLRQTFWRAMAQMDTRNVFGEMATFQTRIDQLATRLATSQEASAWWIQMANLGKQARDAAAAGDQKDADRAINQMVKMAERGAKEEVQWRELLQCVQKLARLKKLQANIERDNKAYLSMTDAMAIIETMAQSMKEAIVLVRDQWRVFEAMLLADALVEHIEGVLEDRGSTAAVQEIYRRLPINDMTTVFATADRQVQSNMAKLMQD